MSDILDKIREQITTHKVVLYMKGDAKFPLCGFSGRAIKCLTLCGIKDFLTVNVLADEEIRQGIKEYSNWPTIPQLYINGEFIGGSDIIAEMYESGELAQLLKTCS
ncbi:MAG: Grx4 family monothiol glutaredoxin [Burkholderiales bacterium]|nr:Grx4 family monothiol glutaredoxin [Burkholderiales bacterium]